jgi:hypothetical protein
MESLPKKSANTGSKTICFLLLFMVVLLFVKKKIYKKPSIYPTDRSEVACLTGMSLCLLSWLQWAQFEDHDR